MGLLRARYGAADIDLTEFGEAVGRGYAWAYAFMRGTRNANDLPLLVRIARFFGVTVGYLIGESERARSGEAMTLLTKFEELEPLDRDAVLQLALTLWNRSGGKDGEARGEPPNESGSARRRNK